MKLAVYWYILCWTTIFGFTSAALDFTEKLSASTISTTSNLTTRRPGIKSSVGRRPSLLMRARMPYLYPDDPYRIPRRQYRLEDFLWAGSGDGQPSEDNADGMAWEDGTVQFSGTAAIKVTKTMVLYKTVLSTIYPVEMTPIVVTNKVKATASLTGSLPVTLMPSPSYSPSSQDYSDLMTPSFTPVFVQPTATLPGSLKPTVEPEESNESSESLHDKLSASSADIRYWIQTTIKSKRSKPEHPSDVQFEETMQSRLARIYAAAFKRQLLNSLGIMGQHGRRINSTHLLSNKKGRQRRSSSSTSGHSSYIDVDGGGQDQSLQLHYSDLTRMARTAMNVTVAMMNITWSKPVDLIVMKYVVYAEGTPVPGFVAVKELRMVTKEEMERKLGGYEVVNKAEALVQPLESYETAVSPMPWLMALVALVCLMIIILIVTMFMAYKWKQSRLRGVREGSPSHTEANLVFPAPAEQGTSSAEYAQERPTSQGRRLSASSRSPASSHFRVDTAEETQKPDRSPVTEESKQGMTESSDQQFATSDDKSSGSRLIVPSEGSNSSPRRYKSKQMGVVKKTSKRRRKRRTSHITSLENQHYIKSSRKFRDEVPSTTEHHPAEADKEDDFALTTDICRNMDKISYGNLDICPESLARTPSAQAKKIIDSRPSSHEQKRSSRASYAEEQFEQEKSPAAVGNHQLKLQLEPEEGDEESTHEQDRDLSERSFEITDSASADIAYRKDAEVQTPTRLNRRSPRVRTSPKHRTHGKSSKTSLLATESQEAVQFHHLHPSTDEPNPLGRMRKRFHQFLDDAFNVMASGGRRDGPAKAPQSARVTVSHHVKTKSPGRPWTSHVIREESVRKIRPKSSVILGPPKPAWTIASERRCQSAKSKTFVQDDDPTNMVEECNEAESKRREHLISSRSSSVTQTDGQYSQSDSSKPFLFPKYPTYPEVDICLENDPNRTATPGPSHSRRSILHPLDPAVPLIEAIKDEMKRFERVKVSGSHDGDFSKT